MDDSTPPAGERGSPRPVCVVSFMGSPKGRVSNRAWVHLMLAVGCPSFVESGLADAGNVSVSHWPGGRGEHVYVYMLDVATPVGWKQGRSSRGGEGHRMAVAPPLGTRVVLGVCVCEWLVWVSHVPLQTMGLFWYPSVAHGVMDGVRRGGMPTQVVKPHPLAAHPAGLAGGRVSGGPGKGLPFCLGVA